MMQVKTKNNSNRLTALGEKVIQSTSNKFDATYKLMLALDFVLRVDSPRIGAIVVSCASRIIVE